MCDHGWRNAVDCGVCRPFRPDWRLAPPDALAVALRISLHRRGVKWGAPLATDDQWQEMCVEIIAALEIAGHE